jgi:hypothetical protein
MWPAGTTEIAATPSQTQKRGKMNGAKGTTASREPRALPLGLRAFQGFVKQHRLETGCSLPEARAVWSALGTEEKAVYSNALGAVLPEPGASHDLRSQAWLCLNCVYACAHASGWPCATSGSDAFCGNILGRYIQLDNNK